MCVCVCVRVSEAVLCVSSLEHTSPSHNLCVVVLDGAGPSMSQGH